MLQNFWDTLYSVYVVLAITVFDGTGRHPDASAHLQRATELLREVFFLLNYSSLLFAK